MNRTAILEKLRIVCERPTREGVSGVAPKIGASCPGPVGVFRKHRRGLSWRPPRVGAPERAGPNPGRGRPSGARPPPPHRRRDGSALGGAAPRHRRPGSAAIGSMCRRGHHRRWSAPRRETQRRYIGALGRLAALPAGRAVFAAGSHLSRSGGSARGWRAHRHAQTALQSPFLAHVVARSETHHFGRLSAACDLPLGPTDIASRAAIVLLWTRRVRSISMR